MGILGLNKLLADVAPNAVKYSEIKNYFGRSVSNFFAYSVSLLDLKQTSAF